MQSLYIYRELSVSSGVGGGVCFINELTPEGPSMLGTCLSQKRQLQPEGSLLSGASREKAAESHGERVPIAFGGAPFGPDFLPDLKGLAAPSAGQEGESPCLA